MSHSLETVSLQVDTRHIRDNRRCLRVKMVVNNKSPTDNREQRSLECCKIPHRSQVKEFADRYKWSSSRLPQKDTVSDSQTVIQGSNLICKYSCLNHKFGHYSPHLDNYKPFLGPLIITRKNNLVFYSKLFHLLVVHSDNLWIFETSRYFTKCFDWVLVLVGCV